MSATANGSSKLAAALWYSRVLGWRVFPCNEAKRPKTEHGFHDATTDERQITEWWRKWPDANIGIIETLEAT
jgi:hypothetical protein